MAGRKSGSMSGQQAGRWAGLVFGGLGFAGVASGLFLLIDRLAILNTWTEVEARVIESRIVTSGSQHAALIRVQFETNGHSVITEPASDYRSSKYGWIAETIDRLPVGGTAMIRYHPRNPEKSRLEVGVNFNTFGTPALLAGIGLVFGGVGVLAYRSGQLSKREADARTRAEAVRLARGQYFGVAAFIGVIGIASYGAGIVLLRPALEQRKWPVVSGRVERSDIFTRLTQSNKHSPTTYYVGRLYVTYEFAEHPYRTALVLRNSSTNRETTERMLAAIKPGDVWPVRVNPANPHDAAAADAWPLLLPGAFLFAGLVVSVVTVLVVRSAPRVPVAGLENRMAPPEGSE